LDIFHARIWRLRGHQHHRNRQIRLDQHTYLGAFVSEYYHDDPVEFSEPKSKKFPGFVALLLFVFAGGSFLQTTLAANISLNSGGQLEFGQGIAVTAGCAGSSNLTLTPRSSFVNASGAGAHYLSSVTVTGIPSSCNGKDFQISAFDDNAGTSALPMFNGTKTIANIYSNAGTFEVGFDDTGTAVTSTSGGFTVTFTTPVALASNVVKLTLQSTPRRIWTCDLGGPCTVGETGPGGGIIFYVAPAGFSCGPTGSSTCKNLEIAPSGWNGADSDEEYWSSFAKSLTQMNGKGQMVSDYNNVSLSSIGRGYINTATIIANEANGQIYAANRAQNYRGGGFSDWYLPNVAEANAICRWTTGANPINHGSICVGGTVNQARYGAQSANLGGHFWTSSERMYISGHRISFQIGLTDDNPTEQEKRRFNKVRPIRAF